MMPRAALLLLLVLWPGLAGAAEPDIVARDTAAAMRECREAGGRPSLQRSYQTIRELNGDGQPDYLIDLSGLSCNGAESYLCGSAGCPLRIYVSGAGGSYRQVFSDHVQAWSLDRASPQPVLVLDLHGGACGRVGSAACRKRLAWNGTGFAAAGNAAAATPASPVPSPGARTAPAPAPTQPAAATVGWSLRQAPGRPAVAVSEGPGAVQNIALLCHEGVPVAALVLRAAPPWPQIAIGFASARRRVDLPITQAPGGGRNTWFGDLRNSPLPQMLATDTGKLRLTINGGNQGDVSLAGSAAAVRTALAGCYRF